MRTESLQETAEKGVEAIHTMVRERDELLVDSDRMRTDIALLRQRCAQLESHLATAQLERDHYMRFCTELVGDLHNIEGIINSAVAAAKGAAFTPSLVPTPKQPPEAVSAHDQRVIEGLIARLPMNGGSDPKQPRE
jgi:hypothetical protein